MSTRRARRLEAAVGAGLHGDAVQQPELVEPVAAGRALVGTDDEHLTDGVGGPVARRPPRGASRPRRGRGTGCWSASPCRPPPLTGRSPPAPRQAKRRSTGCHGSPRRSEHGAGGAAAPTGPLGDRPGPPAPPPGPRRAAARPPATGRRTRRTPGPGLVGSIGPGTVADAGADRLGQRHRRVRGASPAATGRATRRRNYRITEKSSRRSRPDVEGGHVGARRPGGG